MIFSSILTDKKKTDTKDIINAFARQILVNAGGALESIVYAFNYLWSFHLFFIRNGFHLNRSCLKILSTVKPVI